jgi:Thrombospondin type 3 repeat
MSRSVSRRGWLLLRTAAAAFVVLCAMLVATWVAASMPYNPLFEFTAISSSAPGANANITFRTELPAGNHLIGSFGLEVPENSWNIAGSSAQLEGNVTAVGTMMVNLDPDGNCNDGDSGSPQNYGPFRLVETNPSGGGAPYASWGRLPASPPVITDFGDGNPNTYWDLSLDVDPLGTGFTINGFLTSAITPAGVALCTPQVFTLTMCGRANTAPGATTCGSGSNPVVMTNPAAAGCYSWQLITVADFGLHSASLPAGVPIGGTPCDNDGDGVVDPSDNCPRWPNPAQNLPLWLIPAGDPDCDGVSTAVENSAGTNRLLQCGYGAWPGDVTNDTFSDISDVSALTAKFAFSVPPAPARYDIAPDPVDGFVDITDVSKMTSFFSLTCAPCPADSDCDAVTNISDNCPNWSNPLQNLPLWPVPANDPDCDGFSTSVETSAGTNPLAHCGAGAWPADLNNDGFSDITDVSALTVNFGLPVPPAPARQDIAPDPVDHFVDITDVSKLTLYFSLTCN